MNFPFYIAKRYVISFSKNNAINIITGIATLGIIVGTIALFVVLSVFNGLKDFSLSFTNSSDPDLKAISTLGKSFIITPIQEDLLKNVEGLELYHKVVEERVLFSYKEKEQIAHMKGVDNNYLDIFTIHDKELYGTWLSPDTNQAVIGFTLATKLSIGLLDFNNLIEVFVPKPGTASIDNLEDAFNKTMLIPMGVYKIGEATFDAKYVFLDIKLAQSLLEMEENRITSLEFKIKQNYPENKIRTAIHEIFDNKLTILNRSQQNVALYKMLNTENIAVYLIFTLVLIVTLFNLIGAIIMMILDKKNNLKTLYNLGVTIKELRRIFFIQGLILCCIGTVIGLFLGILLVILQQKFNLVMINASFPFPVQFSMKNVFLVIVTIACLGFIASNIASSRVTQNLFKN